MTSVTEKTIPLTRIQRLIGKLMLKSKHEMPCCYLERDVDVTDLVKTRKRWCKETGVRVSTNDFFYLAISRAIERFPLMAAGSDDDGEHITISEHVGVGFAVAAAQGLVVPIIKDTTGMTLAQIAARSDKLLKKARSNRLMPDDFDGANIVMSSLGMYGIDSFYAIAPPGAIGIIAMGKLKEMPRMADDGQIEKRRVLSLSLTVNQMIVNEFYAAEFLACVVEQLEDSQSLTK